MRLQPDGRARVWGVLAVLAAFFVCGVARYWNAQGDDLASSYVGCRLVATGNAAHLYDFDPDDFAGVGDNETWQAQADFGGFESYLHPYVQTPLWAYVLQPVCRGSFAGFEHLFAVGMMLSLVGCLWLVAWAWAPTMLNPYAMAVVAVCLWFSEPYRYAMSLMQTHVLFLLMTVAALVLAERRRSGWAGLLLACAAAVKITPAVLVVYWLLTRRAKAAVSMALWSAAIAAVTVLVMGRGLMVTYLEGMQRISRIVLASFNNQSVAAWWMGLRHPAEVWQFHMLPLSNGLRLACVGLMLAMTVAGGLVDRGAGEGRPPLGAMMALLAGTMCAPIAWTHYSILLAVPMMVLWQERRGRRWMGAALAAMVVLNVWPLAMNEIAVRWGRLTVIRGAFYAEVLCLGVLAAVAWMRRSQGADVLQTEAQRVVTASL